MKIGIVCPYNMALGGAVQEISKEMYDELSARGHEVVILSPRPKQGEPNLPNYRVIYIDKANDLTLMGTTAQVSFCTDRSSLKQIFDTEKFDIIHMHEPWVPLMNSQILRQATCPVAATFHAKLPDGFVGGVIKTIGQLYTKPLLGHISEFVAVSEPAAEHINSVLGRAVRVVPNAINLKAYTAPKTFKPLNTDKKTLLFIGRLEKRKGVAHLLRAFKVLHSLHPDTKLLIGGKGPERVKLEQQVLDEDIKGVEFLGFLEDNYKKELLQRADLFVAPAIYGESFGVILIEALASGQVVVAGDNPGYRSVMKGFGEVSLVDPKDYARHAALLEKLLYDKALREQYRAWAKDYVKQYDYSVVTDQYEKIFTSLVGKATV